MDFFTAEPWRALSVKCAEGGVPVGLPVRWGDTGMLQCREVLELCGGLH